MRALIENLGRLCGLISITILIASLLTLPWLLGGVVPLGRLVLLAGSLLASGFCLLSFLLDQSRRTFVPILLFPLLGIVGLGLWQLQPVDTPLIVGMESALTPVPPSLLGVEQSVGTLAADETRSTVAIYVSLCLIALCGTQLIHSRRMLTVIGASCVLNAIAVSSVGFVFLFDEGGLPWNHRWLVSDNVTDHAFATFINPNNAAGWLCLGYACAVGWAGFLMKRTVAQGNQKYGRLNTAPWERLWQRTVYFLADLTPWQILSAIVVVFLAAAVLATQSRGGFVAVLFGTLLVLGLRSSVRALPGILVAFVICGAGIFGVLKWMDVDGNVVGEIESLSAVEVGTDTRILLWLDSLNITADFPLTGTGLGTYKFAILPYQSRDSRLWFRNADNQFVEMLVEGGIPGFLLMLAVGAVGILTSIAASRQRHHRADAPHVAGSRVSRRLLSALGLLAGVATLTQAFSGLFDFGIALPAASSVLILILAACCGFLSQSDTSGSVLQRVALPCPRVLLLLVYAVPAWVGFRLLDDQWAAVQLDDIVVSSRRLLKSPVTTDNLKQVPDSISQVKVGLRARPDDWDAHRVLMWLSIAQFRHDVLRAADPNLDEEQRFHIRWEGMTLFTTAERLARLRSEDPYARYDSLKQMAAIGGRLKLPQTLQQIQSEFPLMPYLAEERARLDGIFELGQAAELFAAATFVRPASASLHYELGLLAAWNRRYADAKQQWQQSLALSERHRGDILVASAQFSSPQQALADFGPESYSAAVQAAMNTKDQRLVSELWQLADRLWDSQSPPTEETTCLFRATQLEQRGSVDEAIDWLDSCLKNPGDNVRISERLAKLLEKEGRYRDALEQWSRIQYLEPKNLQASEAIARILNRE